MYITCITITIPKMEAGNARKLMEKNAHPTRFEIGKNPTCTVKLRERKKKKKSKKNGKKKKMVPHLLAFSSSPLHSNHTILPLFLSPSLLHLPP